MHGFPDNQHLYDALFPLPTRQHHVLSFDFLGWGTSDKPVGKVYDVASQRADLDAAVAHFGLQQVVPVLHDMAGPVGIDWVLDNPQRSRAQVQLIDAGYCVQLDQPVEVAAAVHGPLGTAQ